MRKREFINEVLGLLNEAGMAERESFQLSGGDNSEVVRQIEGVYRSAWMKGIEVVPRSWLRVADFSTFPEDEVDGTGYVVLPEDWYLLYAFRMKGWKRSVYRCAEEGDGVAKMQSWEYARGTMWKPVCVLEVELSGEEKRRRLHYYSLPRGKEHEVEIALYVPICKGLDELGDEDELGEEGRFAEVLCYLAGSCVARSFEKWDCAKSLEQGAMELVHGLVSGEEGGRG